MQIAEIGDRREIAQFVKSGRVAAGYRWSNDRERTGSRILLDRLMNRRGVCSEILRPIGITGSLKRSIVFVGSLNAAERVRAQLTYCVIDLLRDRAGLEFA